MEVQDRKKRTKKLKKKRCSDSMKEAWKMIDDHESSQLECIYEKPHIMETNECNACGGRLYHGDHGFLSCSNPSCGILYKELIDFGAEWRYYGADDNNATDPTRC